MIQGYHIAVIDLTNYVMNNKLQVHCPLHFVRKVGTYCNECNLQSCMHTISGIPKEGLDETAHQRPNEMMIATAATWLSALTIPELW